VWVINPYFLCNLKKINLDSVFWIQNTSEYKYNPWGKRLMSKPIKNNCEKCKVIRFAHEWTIENFSELCSDEIGGYPRICSTKFSPPNRSEYEFILLLNPKGSDDFSLEYVSLYLGLASSPTYPHWRNESIIITNSRGMNEKSLGLRVYLEVESTQMPLLMWLITVDTLLYEKLNLVSAYSKVNPLYS